MSGERTLDLGDAVPPTPFLKWAGGKRRLLDALDSWVPTDFARYVEPFLGAGALFFHLHATGRIRGQALLNDANPELMTCYRVVQDPDRLPRLIERLREHAEHVTDSDYYYDVRSWDRQPGFAARSPVERAARTIFLNHTCYNGLYRLNRKGQFNVPYGKWRRPPRLFDEAVLRACHRALQDARLLNEDFEACLARAGAGDFIYLDPPYHPLSTTSSFTAYTGIEFREADQRRLAQQFRELDQAGCRLLLTNSATPLIRRLYRGYTMDTFLARRAINSQARGRGEIEELLVTNANPSRAGS
jgi:DNA adenine methylase